MDAVATINRAYAERGRRALPHWPAALRVKALLGYHGLWEMTWSFVCPDGRATFDLIHIDGQPAIRWRRIGGHEIFREP